MWAHSQHKHCQRERNILSLPEIELRFLGGPFSGLLITKAIQQTAEYDKTDSNIVCFRLGNSPASEFCMPTFRNTLSVPSS